MVDLPSSPLISVVLPVYRNRATLHDLYEGLVRTLEAQAAPFELVFVDDACPENSFKVLEALAHSDARVSVIAHARNAGQHRAIMTGLCHARGGRLIVMDADLQDPPEAIPGLLAALDQGAAAAFAVRRSGAQHRGRRATSRGFKLLMHWLTGLPVDAGTYLAMSHEAAARLAAFEEQHPHIPGMIACLGLPLVTVPYQRALRPLGRSGYSGLRRWRLALPTLLRALLYWKRGRPGPARRGSDAPLIRERVGAAFSEQVLKEHTSESRKD